MQRHVGGETPHQRPGVVYLGDGEPAEAGHSVECQRGGARALKADSAQAGELRKRFNPSSCDLGTNHYLNTNTRFTLSALYLLFNNLSDRLQAALQLHYMSDMTLGSQSLNGRGTSWSSTCLSLCFLIPHLTAHLLLITPANCWGLLQGEAKYLQVLQAW